MNAPTAPERPTAYPASAARPRSAPPSLAPAWSWATPWRNRFENARIALAGEVLFRLTRLLIGSADLRVLGLAEVLEAKRQGRPIVFVGWHTHDFVNLGVYQPIFGARTRGVTLVRDTRDGLVLHYVGQRMGIDVALLGADPTSSRSARGVVRMINLISHGSDGLLAVDGPEGPAYQAKRGAALIAQRAGAVLVPAAAACRVAVHLRHRWDEHVIPLPWTRIVVSFGPLIDAAPPDCLPRSWPSIERLTGQIQQALNEGRRYAAARVREP